MRKPAVSRTVTFGSPETNILRLGLGEVYSADPEPYRGVDTIVTVQAGGFTGRVSATLFTTDLKKLLTDLRRLDQTLTGSLDFTTLEGQVGFSIQIIRTGHVEVHGEVVDVAGTGNTLRFRLGLDQTFLPPARETLGAFVRDLD